MLRFIGLSLVVLVLLATPMGSAVQAAPDAGVVGDGTPGSCTAAALNAALAGGGTVTFNCGGPKTILVTSQMTITQDTVIQGGGIITITGGLSTRLFQVVGPASLALNDITLDSAFNVGSDGGAILSSGTLSLNNVTIQNSQTDNTYCGGAIWTNGVTYIANSTLKNNTAGYGGGAICTGAFGSARLQIIDSNFLSNKAVNTGAGYGGAILMQSGVMTLTNGLLFNNSAQSGGGIALRQSAIVTLTGSGSTVTLNGNTASNFGGAIYNEAGTLGIVNGFFSANSTPTNALSYGGAIANLGAMTLSNSYFSTNQARYGGAVFVGGNITNASATIRDTTFSRNTAGVFGGGLYTNVEATNITVTNSAFDSNSASSGGGLARVNARLSITQVILYAQHGDNGRSRDVCGSAAGTYRGRLCGDP